jgi:hypothetical protein
MVIKVHRETLNTMQRFWQALTRKTVPFRTLAHTVRTLDDAIRQAERIYKCVAASCLGSNARQLHTSHVGMLLLLLQRSLIARASVRVAEWRCPDNPHTPWERLQTFRSHNSCICVCYICPPSLSCSTPTPTCRSVLQRHSGSFQIVRLYAKVSCYAVVCPSILMHIQCIEY